MNNIISTCLDWHSTEQSLADAGFSSKAIDRLVADYIQLGATLHSVRLLPLGRVAVGFFDEGSNSLSYDLFSGKSLRFCRFIKRMESSVTANSVCYVS